MFNRTHDNDNTLQPMIQVTVWQETIFIDYTIILPTMGVWYQRERQAQRIKCYCAEMGVF